MLCSTSINSLLDMYAALLFSLFFFFNDTATTEIYTLSLHDALPIYQPTDDVSERRADGDRGEEDREHPAASLAREVVGQERRGDRAVGRFTDAHRSSGREQRRVARRQARERRRHAPNRDAEA